jgi:hypothetical protein
MPDRIDALVASIGNPDNIEITPLRHEQLRVLVVNNLVVQAVLAAVEEIEAMGGTREQIGQAMFIEACLLIGARQLRSNVESFLVALEEAELEQRPA